MHTSLSIYCSAWCNLSVYHLVADGDTRPVKFLYGQGCGGHCSDHWHGSPGKVGLQVWCGVLQCRVVCCSMVQCGVVGYSTSVQQCSTCTEKKVARATPARHTITQTSLSKKCWNNAMKMEWCQLGWYTDTEKVSNGVNNLCGNLWSALNLVMQSNSEIVGKVVQINDFFGNHNYFSKYFDKNITTFWKLQNIFKLNLYLHRYNNSHKKKPV